MNLPHLPPDVRIRSTTKRALRQSTVSRSYEYLKALGLLVMCSTIVVVVYSLVADVELAQAAFGYAIMLFAGTLISVAAMFIGAIAGSLDFGGSLLLMIVRASGAVSAMMLALTTVPRMPFYFDLILLLFIFIGIMEWLFDYSLHESIVFGFILAVAMSILQILATWDKAFMI